MPRPAEMVEKIDTRDHAPGTQSADLSNTGVQPASHWEDQARARADQTSDSGSATGSGSSTAARSEGAGQNAPAPEAPQHDPASSAQPPAESQARSGQADADASSGGRVEVAIAAEWSDHDGGSHSREMRAGVDYDHQSDISADVQDLNGRAGSGSDGGPLESTAPLAGITSGELVAGLAEPVASILPLDVVQDAVASVGGLADDLVDDSLLDIPVLGSLASGDAPLNDGNLLEGLFEPLDSQGGLDALAQGPLPEDLDLADLTAPDAFSDLTGVADAALDDEGAGLLGSGLDVLDEGGGVLGL